MIQEQDELIKILKSENDRLQELLEGQLIINHKDADATKERITRVCKLPALTSFFLSFSFSFSFSFDRVRWRSTS